jgi:hypothetical protein
MKAWNHKRTALAAILIVGLGACVAYYAPSPRPKNAPDLTYEPIGPASVWTAHTEQGRDYLEGGHFPFRWFSKRDGTLTAYLDASNTYDAIRTAKARKLTVVEFDPWN